MLARDNRRPPDAGRGTDVPARDIHWQARGRVGGRRAITCRIAADGEGWPKLSSAERMLQAFGKLAGIAVVPIC